MTTTTHNDILTDHEASIFYAGIISALTGSTDGGVLTPDEADLFHEGIQNGLQALTKN